MALDTFDKRASAVSHIAIPSLPSPDSTIDQGDRQQTTSVYRGLLASGAAVIVVLHLHTPRQVIAYTDRMNAWRPTHSQSLSTGRPEADSWELIYENCPCHFEVQRSPDSPALFGRIETDNMFSRDRIYFAGTLELDGDWVIKNVSFDANGTQCMLYGRFWRVLGRTQRHWNRGSRRARRGAVEAVQMDQVPEGIT